MSTQDVFIPSRYCGICRLKLPGPHTYSPPLWQLDTLAAIKLTNGRFYVVRLATFLSEDFDLSIKSRGLAATIKSDQHRSSESSQIVYRLHTWCYNILKWRRPGTLPEELYNLAHAITPISPIWNALYMDHGLSDSLRALQRLPQIEVNDQDDLFYRFSNVSSEISSKIWAFVGAEAPYSCLVLVALGSCVLLDVIRRHSNQVLYVQPVQIYGHVTRMKQSGILEATPSITVFGSDYLGEIIPGIQLEQLLNTPGADVRMEIHFAMRIGGICALKSLIANQETRWDGNTRGAWFGSFAIRSLHARCLFNGLTYLPELEGQEKILWDHPDPLLIANIESSLVGPALMSDDSSCLLRYVPLCRQQDFSIGITVYVTKIGISGIQTHFPTTSYMSGRQAGCPIHLALQRDERLAYVWIREITGSNIHAPALIIQTTFGRFGTFGPYILPTLERKNSTNWNLLCHQKSIAALFYPNPTPNGIIKSFGVIGDGDGELMSTVLEPPQYYDCPLPTASIASPNVGLFISVAQLTNLKRVDFCYTRNRCIGMMAHYNDGGTTVLGQWQTSQSQTCTSYSAEVCHSRIAITTVAVLNTLSIVTDISFLPANVDAPREASYILNLESPVVWWFCEEYDVIETFRGRSIQVSDSNKTYQQ